MPGPNARPQPRPPNADPKGQAARLAQILKSLREAQRLHVADVAREMGMPQRSYEHFEAGHGRLDLRRLERFAEVTRCDPYAITIALMLQRPEFALRVMDNKLMVILLFALEDFDDDLGDDIALIEPQALHAAFQRVFQDLADYVRRKDQIAERWLEARARQKGLDVLLRRPL